MRLCCTSTGSTIGDVWCAGIVCVAGDCWWCRWSLCCRHDLCWVRNMKVTSSLVIAIIVNKRLWRLYSFHGYRHPIQPSARTRFLCGMANVMTSMVMESLTRTNNQGRLLDIEQTLSYLQQLNLIDYMTNPNHRKLLMKCMNVNLISFRQIDADGMTHIHTFSDDDADNVEVSAAAFDCLNDTYG